MKLYFSPGACSQGAHIVLHELGLKHTVEQVDLKSQPHVLAGTTTAYTTVNPKGSVPALKLDDGQVLTENAAILQYLGDQKPDSGLLAQAGTMARYRQMEWLSFLGADIHKSFSPLFNPKVPDEMKTTLLQNLDRRLSYVEKHLANNQYLMGDKFFVGDAYLFVMLGWMPRLQIDIAPYPNLKAYQARIGARPSVAAAHKVEGLN